MGFKPKRKKKTEHFVDEFVFIGLASIIAKRL